MPYRSMNSGIPVIAGNCSALPEVCGDAAQLIDPRNQDDLASALVRLAGDDAHRAELAARGQRRAGQFTWENAVGKTIAAYRDVL